MDNTIQINKSAATRFIEAFNTNDWDAVRDVVAPEFVLHHPIAGTHRLGPEGMVAVWTDFKCGLPDAWHPIPIMIADGDRIAVLLPTYGHFTGEPHQGASPTGASVQYGMVNIVRLDDGKLVEAWFGMDPVIEMQQLGTLPSKPGRQLRFEERANIGLFEETVNPSGSPYDNVTAFGNAVVALGPPQHGPQTTVRTADIYLVSKGVLRQSYHHQFATRPPHSGALGADCELARSVVKRFFGDVLAGHDMATVLEVVSEDVLIHPTAMPCEAAFYGISGMGSWLSAQWEAFPDLRVIDYSTVAQGDIVVARWVAQGTSRAVFESLPPTGQRVEFSGVSMYRIENGKIAEVWDTRDTLAIMRQLDPAFGLHPHSQVATTDPGNG